MKTGRQYLFNALFPAITIFVIALIRMPDCGQCVILSFVGSGLVFMVSLLLGLSYFLMSVKIYENTTRILVGLLATFTPSILLTILLVNNYYDPESYRNSDFEIAGPAIVTTFFVSIWIFYLYIKDKPIENQDPDDANS
jgi:hypothetical protein